MLQPEQWERQVTLIQSKPESYLYTNRHSPSHSHDLSVTRFINSQHLNEKCDVFGFGVVLLEVITGQPAKSVVRGGLNDSLINWVTNIIETKGDVRLVIDLRLRRNYDISSAWKFIEIATACVRVSPDDRTIMNKVVIKLKQCLNMEKERKFSNH